MDLSLDGQVFEDSEATLPILIVDDDDTVRRALAKLVASLGHPVETADSGQTAIGMLGRTRYAVMLCDVKMPEISGLEVIPSAKELDPDLAIIMVSALNEVETAVQAMRAGASDYITKPVERIALRAAIDRGLKERAYASRTATLEREKGALRSLTVRTAESLLNAMEAKDPYLKGHSQRVADLAAAIAGTLGLDTETTENVRLAGRLADVGKIGTRLEVLNKPSALSSEEFDHVQDHVRIGVEILSPMSHLGIVIDYVRDHHEHYDGTGYPRRLEGDEISVGGRILAAADAFVALTSRRAYREPLSDADAVELLRESAGSLLDWRVYAALRTVIHDRLGIAPE